MDDEVRKLIDEHQVVTNADVEPGDYYPDITYPNIYEELKSYILDKNWNLINDIILNYEGWLRGTTMDALVETAAEGADISPAIPTVKRVFFTDYPLSKYDSKINAVKVLTHHYLNKKKWKEVSKLLAKDDGNVVLAAFTGARVVVLVKALKCRTLNVRAAAVEALENLAECALESHPSRLWPPSKPMPKRDIGAAVPFLQALLRRKNIMGVKALTYYYLDNKKWGEIENLLEKESDVSNEVIDAFSDLTYDLTYKPAPLARALLDGERRTRWKAYAIIRNNISHSDHAYPLNETQEALEYVFAEWLSKQPQGRTKEKVDRELQTSKLLMAVSNKKAELAKQDGELLLGETVKKPKDKDKKMYRALQRDVIRNA